MFNKEQILEKLAELDLPLGEYALGTSAVLVLNGLKEYANDLDIDCSAELFDSFLLKGYMFKIYEPKKGYKAKIIDLTDDIQLIRKVDLNQNDIVNFEGFSVYTLEAVCKFKQFLGREKDLKDIELINKFLT